MMQRMFGLLLLLVGGVSGAADFAVAPFVEAIPGGVHNDYTLGLHVYALPEFRLVASHPQIVGLTTVSNDGTRLYELDLGARRIRTFEIPSLRLMTDVSVVGQMPYFDNTYWIREHPRRPGVLMLRGVYWFDANTGEVLETHASFGIPAGSYYNLNVSISQATRKLQISDFRPQLPAQPFVKIIDLDDPGNVQTLPVFDDLGVLMEQHGLVSINGITGQTIIVRNIDTLQQQDVIELPTGLVTPWALTPAGEHTLLLSAATSDHHQQVLLKLNLEDSTFVELSRETVDNARPGFAIIEAKGNRILLAALSEPGLPIGAIHEPIIGQLRQINMMDGTTSVLHWPAGGGPYSGGHMLAQGSLRAIPINAWALGASILAVLILGLYRARLLIR
jgi:hypothetical protein